MTSGPGTVTYLWVIDGSVTSAILHHSQTMCPELHAPPAPEIPRRMNDLTRNCYRKLVLVGAALSLFSSQLSGIAQGWRSLGIDVSAWQGNISAANWATLKRATNVQVGGVFGDGRDFVMIRSTRGGTTGEDHRQGGYASGNNTFYNF